MMTEINIKYMSDEAIETLKANIEKINLKFADNPNNCNWLEEFINDKVFVEKKFKINDFELEIPSGNYDKSIDIKNSIILYESLKDLPRYVLTDEQFWAWINFEKGYEVALKIMPIQKSVFKDHWLFTQGKRRGIFFGVLSRSFFRVALTVDESLEDKYELTKFIVEKPERFRHLTWRTFSSEKKIVLGALKAEYKIYKEYGDIEKTKYFSEIAKYISQLGSVMLLDVMSENDIEEYVYVKYKELLEVDLVSV